MGAFHPGHRQLPQIRPPDDRVQRLELVDVAGDCAAAVDRSGASAFCRSDRLRRCHADGDGVRRDQRFIVVLPQQLRRLRRLPRGHHPFARTGRRQRQRPRPARGADPAHRRRVGRIRRRGGADTRRRPAGRFAGRAPGIRSVAGDHRAVGRRQDHAAAQPGRIVAVRLGDAALPGRRQRDDVLVAVALCASGFVADRGVLSELAGRHLGRVVARHLDKGRAGTADRSSRRRA